MSAPWEKYQQSSAPEGAGPWAKYGNPAPPETPAAKQEASAPPPAPPKPERSITDFAFNQAPRSAANLVGGIVNAVTHPVDTAKGLAQLGVGTIEALTPDTPQGPPKRYAPVAQATGQMLKERYGSPSAVAKTLYEDPVGAAADVAAVATGAGGLFRGGAKLAQAANVTRTASALGKTADVAAKVGKFTDPVWLGGKAASKAAKGTGFLASEVLGKTTGAGGEAIRTAAKSPTPALREAMRGGVSEMDIVGDFRDALNNAKDARGQKYRQQLAGISSLNTPPLDLTPVRQEMMTRLKAFNVQITPEGLDFSRVPIANPSERKMFENIVGDIMGWGSQQNDLTPLGVDTLKRRIDDFYSESSKARAFVQGMKKSVEGVLNQQVPGYQKMTRDYAVASDFIKRVESELSLGNNKNPGTVIRKLTYALNQNNDYRKLLTEALDNFSNAELKNQLAGYHLRNVTPRGLMGPLTATGAVVGGALFTNPTALTGLGATSPRLVGEIVTNASRIAKAGGKYGKPLFDPAKKIILKPPVYRGLQAGQAIPPLE